MKGKLVIAMVGLPARGKSTMALKIARTLAHDDLKVEIFNNGELRRRLSHENTSAPDFFSPYNPKGSELRENCARLNLGLAQSFLSKDGDVAIIDQGGN